MGEVSERRDINIVQGGESTARLHEPIDDGIRGQWLCEEPRVRRELGKRIIGRRELGNRELGKGCKGRRRLGEGRLSGSIHSGGRRTWINTGRYRSGSSIGQRLIIGWRECFPIRWRIP